MVFFALVISPPGNVAASFLCAVRSWRNGSWGPWEGLPCGVYLGFGTGQPEPALDAFAGQSRKLLSRIPERLAFSGPAWRDGFSFVAQASPAGEGPMGDAEGILEAAGDLMEAIGLSRMEKPPFPAFFGLFAGKSVTPRDGRAFSFKHFELRLLRLECSNMEGNSLYWEVAKRQKRLVGPRSSRSRGG